LLVQCGWAATRTKNTYLRSKYDSLVKRRGKKRALIAVGHKILIAAYFILRDKKAYSDLGYCHLQQLNKERKLRYHTRQLRELGLELDVHEILNKGRFLLEAEKP